jgi:hypothetical protein
MVLLSWDGRIEPYRLTCLGDLSFKIDNKLKGLLLLFFG